VYTENERTLGTLPLGVPAIFDSTNRPVPKGLPPRAFNSTFAPRGEDCALSARTARKNPACVPLGSSVADEEVRVYENSPLTFYNPPPNND